MYQIESTKIYGREVKAMLEVALCDDEPIVKALLERCLMRYSFRERNQGAMDFHFTFYPSAKALMESDKNFDILFLDIALEDGRDGIAEAKQLRKAGIHIPIVLLTSMNNRYVDGYEANIFRYLLKPIDENKIFETLDAVLCYFEESEKAIEIMCNGSSHFIYINDIIYVETYHRKRLIYTTPGTYETTEAWEHLTQRLPQNRFYRVNRSYVVNFSHVRSISKAAVTMDNGTMINFSRLNKNIYDEFREKLKAYLVRDKDKNLLTEN